MTMPLHFLAKTSINVTLGDDHLILRGGGWHFWSGQIIYFHHGLGRKIYFRVNRGQNIYFQPQQIFEKAKKKKKEKKKEKKKNGGGGCKCKGLVEGAGHGFLCFA